MRLWSPAIRILFGKEVRQLTRNRQALSTSAVLPLILQLLVPLFEAFAIGLAAQKEGAAGLGVGAAGRNPGALYGFYLLPTFVCLSAVIAPSVTSVAAIVNERERRTMELLVALPAQVSEIVTAKLLATLAITGLVVLPLTLVDGLLAVVVGQQPALLAVALIALSLGGMVCSIGSAAALAMLARDYRTAQQLTALVVVPVLALASALLLGLRGVPAVFTLAALLAAAGVSVAWLVARRFSFERYLS